MGLHAQTKRKRDKRSVDMSFDEPERDVWRPPPDEDRIALGALVAWAAPGLVPDRRTRSSVTPDRTVDAGTAFSSAG